MSQYENAIKYLSKFLNKLPKCPKLCCCEKLLLGNNDSKVDFKRACFHSIFYTLESGILYEGVANFLGSVE